MSLSYSPRIHHQRSRYVYELFFKRKAISRGMFAETHVKQTTTKYTLLSVTSPIILLVFTILKCTIGVHNFNVCVFVFSSFLTFSSELYEYCLNEGFADRNLIAKWKKVSFNPKN